MDIQNLISDLPGEIWQQMKEKTKTALAAADKSDFEYFKFVYTISITGASAILNEYHLPAGWDESRQSICSRLRKALGNVAENVPVNISFAGQRLNENQNLADLGAVYGDKIYFTIGKPEEFGVEPAWVEAWVEYFKRFAGAVKTDPSIYIQIVEDVCNQIESSAAIENWSADTWKKIVLMRNLPGIYASLSPGRLVLKPVRRLIQTLKTALAQDSFGAVYHAANALEWLCYLKPTMFEGVDLFEDEKARAGLVENLLAVLDPAQEVPGLVRMEAAWAIGWISVASQAFGQEVYGTLMELERQEKFVPMALVLRGAALRSFLYPTPYFLAATSQQAGWFQASILDVAQFRNLAMTGQHKDALKNFREKMGDSLPNQ